MDAKHWLKSITVLTKKRWFLIVIFSCIFAILDDFLSFYNVIPHITVRIEYLDVLYGALCSVAVLGNALLAIAVGTLDTKVYGLTVREICAVSSSDYDVATTLVFSSLAVIFGIPAYVFNACTCITALLVSVVFVILRTSIDIWGLLSNDWCSSSKIQTLIENEAIDHDALYVKWLAEVKVAIDSRDEEKQKKFVRLIYLITASTKDSNAAQTDVLQKGITDLFPSACKTLGFVAAYKRFVGMDRNEYALLDARSIVENYAKS